MALLHPSLSRRAAIVGVAATLLCVPPAAARVVDGVAAVVNEDVILVSEINDAMRPFMRQFRERYSGAELQAKLRELQEAVVKKAIEDRLILQVAATAGITADKGQVEERYNEIVKRFGSIETFEHEMRERGMTPREFRKQIEEQVIVQDTVRQVIGSKIRVTDNEIKEYYRRHESEFALAPARRVTLIFLQFSPNMPAFQRDQVRRRAEQIRRMAEEGALVSKLATKFSDGPHRENAGDLGYVMHGEILPELEDAVFAAEVNALPAIVEAQNGVYLFNVTGARPGRIVPLSEAKPRLAARLTEEKQSARYDEWIANLKSQSFIDRNL